MSVYTYTENILGYQVANPETDIRWYFPQFSGNPHSIHDVKLFIRAMFVSVKRDRDRQIFDHFTTAVDTENIKMVFNDVREMIFQKNLVSLMLN